MILSREEKPNRKPEIDLSGPDGNAFVLIGIAKRYARDMGLDGEMIAKEMMLGDYEDLLATFERYFGEHVILYR
jgi:hypothetical protein